MTYFLSRRDFPGPFHLTISDGWAAQRNVGWGKAGTAQTFRTSAKTVRVGILFER